MATEWGRCTNFSTESVGYNPLLYYGGETVSSEGVLPAPEPEVCEICVFPIEEEDQQCPAQYDGRCWA
jgi:hypothetical protein